MIPPPFALQIFVKYQLYQAQKNQLSSASSTALEKECKAHDVQTHKDKKHMINNLRKHLFSPAHPESSTIKIENSLLDEKMEVKEELVWCF